MKKILVPTDFSRNADNATAFALHIANQFESEVHFLHSFSVSSSAFTVKNINDILRREAEENMEALIDKFRGQLEGGTTIEGKVVMGSAISSTTYHAEKKDIDLIIMGTQGATDALEVFIGSVTGGVLTNTKVPVLAVPSEVSFKPFNNIVLALDDKKNASPRVFGVLQKIASAFQAKVTIFHMKTENDKGVDRMVEEHLKGVEVAYVEWSVKKNVYQTINEFVEESGTGLLCMVRRKRGFFESLFEGSSTLKQAYNSSVPLLVLIDD